MKKHFIVPAVFLALLIATGIMYVVVPDADISADENRTLASFPEFSVKSLADGSYTAALNSYMTDQFPLRKTFISAGDKITSLLSYDGGGVAVVMTNASDAGSGETLAEIPASEAAPEKKKPAAAKVELAAEADYNSRGVIVVGDRAMELFGSNFNMLQNYAAIINSLKASLPNVNVYSMLVPTSAEFYSPVKYHSQSRSQKSAIEQVYSMYSPGVIPVDAYTYLAASADRYIYFRSDHHWTVRGAYQGYYAFCEAAGLTARAEDSFPVTQVEGGFLGTLYRATKKQSVADNPDTVEVLTPPEAESCVAYTNSSMAVSYDAGVIVDPGTSTNKYLTFLGGDNPVLHIVTNNKNGRRVMIIKDSFGNAFTPFLINHYEEIYALDARSAGGKAAEFCAEHQIDDVIIENYAFALSNPDILSGLKGMAGE